MNLTIIYTRHGTDINEFSIKQNIIYIYIYIYIYIFLFFFYNFLLKHNIDEKMDYVYLFCKMKLFGRVKTAKIIFPICWTMFTFFYQQQTKIYKIH